MALLQSFPLLAIGMAFSAMTVAVDDPNSQTGLMNFEDSFAGLDHDPLMAGDLEIPVVLTASRLRQSQLDTPASVTVIEADTIAVLGIKNIEEIFRLVPGMLVGYHSGFGEKFPAVSYHGTQSAEHRRLQVLIDGRSVFKPGLARVEWVDIPLAVEDIARIEVIRGPNSATYGANSYLGVINILTKHPQQESGNILKVTSGNRGVWGNYLNIATNLGSTDIRFTAGSREKDGFDVLNDPGNPPNLDGSEAVYSILRTYTHFDESFNIEAQLGYKSGVNQQKQNLDDFFYYITEEEIEAKDTFAWLKLNKEFTRNQFSHIQAYTHKFDRTQEWTACLLPSIAGALSVPAACGLLDKNLDEVKSELELQHTSVWSDEFRTVVGARYRVDEMISNTYSDGRLDNENISAFANFEYKLGSLFTANLGGMYEDDEINGNHFSPRVALNTHVTPNDTIRLIYSEAIRSPDLFEQEGRTYYSMRNAVDAGTVIGDYEITLYGSATGTLKNESIYSHEISYFGLYPSINAQLDVKLFYDELSGLISESLDLLSPLTNTVRLHQSGIEGQFKWEPNQQHELMLSAAYLDVDDDFAINKDSSGDLTKQAKRESSLSAESSGSLAWLYRHDNATNGSIALYHVDKWNPYVAGANIGYHFFRVDVSAAHSFSLPQGKQLQLQTVAQHRLDNDPIVRSDNIYTDRTHYYVSAQLIF